MLAMTEIVYERRGGEEDSEGAIRIFISASISPVSLY